MCKYCRDDGKSVSFGQYRNISLSHGDSRTKWWISLFNKAIYIEGADRQGHWFKVSLPVKFCPHCGRRLNGN